MNPQRFLAAIVGLIALLIAPNFARAASANRAAVVVVRGTIDEYESSSLQKRFDQARASGATTIIVEIDTYGGLVPSALDISRFIKRQTDLHTIAFVRDKAISAGAMIAMACDEIVMQPSSVIGDCAPIIFRSDSTIEALPPTERAKEESPVLADFRDSAIRNHRDLALAEAMVSIGHPIRFIQNSAGEKKLVNDSDFKTFSDQGWKVVTTVSDPINRADQLLTLYSRDATAIGLSASEYASPKALASARNLQIVATLEPGTGEAFIEMLGSPLARLALIVVFIISLKVSLSMPGHGAPEAVAVISLGLLLGIPLLTGYANWWEVLLIFLGLGLVAFEVFVFPGHFVSAVVGLLMIVIGLILTFAGSEPIHPGMLPTMQTTWVALQRGLTIVTLGMFCSLVLWIWLNRFLPRMPYLGRIVFVPSSGGSTVMGGGGADSVWPLVGATGRASSDLRPGGSAEFIDETSTLARPVAVVTDGAYVRAGEGVVVVESRGSRVVVKPL